jgi:hypothetical protein
MAYNLQVNENGDKVELPDWLLVDRPSAKLYGVADDASIGHQYLIHVSLHANHVNVTHCKGTDTGLELTEFPMLATRLSLTRHWCNWPALCIGLLL